MDDLPSSKRSMGMPTLRGSFTSSHSTLLPSEVPFDIALSILHDHSAMITLNPLVIRHHAVTAPGYDSRPGSQSSGGLQRSHSAGSDTNKPLPHLPHRSDTLSYGQNGREMTYEITDKISYIPKMYAGEVTYTASFMDTAAGCDTVIHAPAGVFTKGSWRLTPQDGGIADHAPTRPTGVQIQEPTAPQQAQQASASDRAGPGLTGRWVLSEEAHVECSVFLKMFVQSQIEHSHADLHQRFIERCLEKVKERALGLH